MTEIPGQLSELTWLEELDISGNHISDLSTLPYLPQLQKLNFSGNKVSDLNALVHVPQLQELGCAYNELRNLDGLRFVPQLQEFFCWHNQINNLEFLVHVPRLLVLMCGQNQISNLTPLKHVPLLQRLICQANQISDLSPLSSLEQLEALDCRLNQITDLSVLSNLMELRTLDCRFNRIKSLHPVHDLVVSKKLNGLHAYDNPVFEIPAGILGEHDYDNCIENLRNYWQDLAKGSEKQQQLKVQLVGNGRVGKTTLAYVLEHKRAPCEPFKSTHGIVIKEIQQALDGEDEPVTLQLWDFGGQEIYHATHRLFLSDDCLYLLLWAEETEEHPDETRHPVSYWLELIHDLAPNSQVIVVKNQIDQFNKLPLEPLDLASDVPGYGQIREFVKISALKYQGMYMLEGAIKEVLQDPKLQVCVELPTSWLQVQRELKQLDQKTIPFAHFKQLCIKAGINHAEWFVDYLHKTGVLFYRKGAFQDQIILDQNWVIEAAYRIFDPKGYRGLVEQMRGSFKGAYTQIFWPDANETERNIYLDFMRNCGICYEPNRKHDTLFADRTFIIPALLPKNSTARAAWHKNATDWQLDIEYPFLHRSIIERIILRIGETYEGEPWRTGIFCHTDEGQLLLECAYANKQQSTQGRLRFQLRGNQLDRLVYALRKLVSQTSPHRRYQEFLSKAGEERIPLPEFKEEQAITTRLEEVKPASKTIKLFISYAHEDEKPYREELDKRLKAIKRQYPMLEPWHDRNLLAGEQVHNKILQQLEVADIVVLLISPDFVDSDYCFSHEMEIALKQYEQNQNIVIPIIIRDTADWHTYQIGNHVALPTDGKPHSQWADKDAFWKDVQQGIRKQVENLLQT